MIGNYKMFGVEELTDQPVIPIQDGWLVCSKLKLVKSAPKIVFITGETRPDLKQFAEFVHADAVLRKPFGVEDIGRVIDELDKDERASA